MNLTRRKMLWSGTSVLAASSFPLAALADDEQVEITLAHAYGKVFRPIHQKIIEKFNKLHPNIKIKLERPYQDYDGLAQRTKSGLTQGNPPDLSFQGIDQVRQYVDNGTAWDMTPWVKADPRWSEPHGYFPAMMALGDYNGHQFSIPFAVSTPILYYNEDLLKKANVNLKSIDTWEGVLTACKQIHKLGNDYSGMYYDYLNTGNWMLQALIYSEGGTMMDASEKKVVFDNEQGIRAAKLFRRFIDEGGMKNWTHAQAEQAFCAGRVGFYCATTGYLKTIEDKTKGMAIKTALFPLNNKGQRKIPCGGNAALILTKDPKKARAAFEYAMFAASAEGTAIQVSLSGYMPMHEKGVELLKDFYNSHPNYRTSLAQIPSIFRWYAFPGDNMLKIMDVMRDEQQRMVSGEISPETCMRQAAKRVQALL